MPSYAIFPYHSVLSRTLSRVILKPISLPKESNICVAKITWGFFSLSRSTSSNASAACTCQHTSNKSQPPSIQNQTSAKESQHIQAESKHVLSKASHQLIKHQCCRAEGYFPLKEDPHPIRDSQYLTGKSTNVVWLTGTGSHQIISDANNSIKNHEYTEGNFHYWEINQKPTTGNQLNKWFVTKSLLSAAGNHHTVLRHYCSTAKQFFARKKLFVIAIDQHTMSQSEHRTSGSGYAQYSSSAQREAAISDSEVKSMNDAREIFYQAVHSVLPNQLVKNKLHLSQNDTILKVDDMEYLLQQNVYVIGFGKAVIGMARAVEDCIGKHIVKGIISVPTGIQETFKNDEKLRDMLVKPESRIVVMEGATGNLPDEASHKAAIEIMKIAEDVKEGDIFLVLISGGGSALLPSPKPPVTLEDMLSLTRLMSRSGASIIQLNTVRKEIELLKGGGLAKLALPARVVALILSDVIGDPLDFIAGGPTVKDTSAPEDSLNVLKDLGISAAIPSSVSQLLTEEHSKSTDQRLDTVDWSHVQNVLVGSNKSACDAACATSTDLGYSPFLLSTKVEGEAQDIGRTYINLAKYISLGLQDSAHNETADLENELIRKFNIDSGHLKSLQELAQRAFASGKKGVCIVAGGETTVVVKGKGIGGRNQEMAVSAALELGLHFPSSCGAQDGISVPLQVVFLAAGTDGIDGPNPAAGGVVSAGFNADAAASGLDVADFLKRNDTFTLLSKVDNGLNHIVIGQTGTNVMDIHILLITRKP